MSTVKELLLPLTFLALICGASPAIAGDPPPGIGGAMIIHDSGDASVLKDIEKSIKSSGGRVVQSIPPHVFMADMPPELDAELVARYGALVFRNRIEDTDFAGKYGAQALAAVEEWNGNIGILSVQKMPTGETHMEVLLETDGENFKVLSKKVVKGPRPASFRQPLREGFYLIEFLDTAGSAVHVKSVTDPTKVFFDYFDEPPQEMPGRLPAHAGKMLRGGIVKLAKARLVVSLPNDQNIRTIRISRQKLSAKGKRNPAAAGRQKLLTEGPSPIPEAIELEPKALLTLDNVPDESK